MADFRQLALEFVLAENEAKQTSLAKQAASEIQHGDASSNPVARWVESVQPWMPGSNDDDVVEGQDTPDWTSRAKALEFLSSTLHHLDPTFLKPSQVKLLVSFFGAMFDIDHKAGIMASATALSKIRQMKSFQPSSGNEIISKLCALKDDFSRQTSVTRLAVYELLRSLITSPDVAKDLKQRHGETAAFMKELLQLCSSERDPDCLLVWFDIQRYFLAEYPATQEILEDVYNIFKAYFPITLPRIAQSNVTPDELKLSLRRCFAANQRLAHLTIPFLVGKMDQGASITVNVKIDILKTLQHCLESYEDKKASIAPYFKDIWGSLKYEVRNGEIEDTIWATLEVLKTLATRLDGDDLRDYTLTVTRDCVVDLSNITYTAPSGRLLVAVLSANPSAFLLMASPTITHLKENLRHPKTPDHNQDLLKILHVLLETRLLLSNVTMTPEQKKEFQSIDNIFKNLYAEVLRTPVQAGSRTTSTEDELKISMRAVQATGALACQVKPIFSDSDSSERAIYPRLLEDSICLEICNDLFTIFTQTAWASEKQRSTDDVLNETARALQRAIEVYSVGFEMLRDQAISIIRQEWSNNGAAGVPAIRALGPLLAFVGCSKLSGDDATALKEFEQLLVRLSTELLDAITAGADPAARSAIAAAIESVFRYFNDACPASAADVIPFSFGDKASWLEYIQSELTSLKLLEGHESATSVGATEGLPPVASGGIRQQFLLAGLAVARAVYLHVTEAAPGSTSAIRIKSGTLSTDTSSEYQFLHHVASLAGFIVHEMSEQQQLSLNVQDLALNIFHENVTPVPAGQKSALSDSDDCWDWLITGDASVLSFSILEVLRPSSIAVLFDRGIAQNILARASSQATPKGSSVIAPVLSVLSNKYVIENIPEFMALLEQNANAALKTAEANSDPTAGLENLNFIYAVACGILRRYSSKKAEGLLKFVRDGPAHPTFGAQLAQRMGVLVAPHPYLTKTNFAVVKPLWMQRVYFELVGPMLKLATDQNAEATVRTNYSVAVVLMLRHMTFSIYEADADQVVRITISTAQSFGSGFEALAALDVLQNILLEAPEKGQDHLRSIINICVPAFTSQQTGSADTQQAAIGKLALEIVGGLPKMYEARRLVQFVPRLERELTLACGHGVRDLRRLARLARQAWAPLK